MTDTIMPILERAKIASRELAKLSGEKRSALVRAIADALEKNVPEILAANEQDCERMDSNDPKFDRLVLTEERIDGIAADARNVAEIDDPVGVVQLSRTLENGLKMEKIAVPLGVVGVIFESRPNVTADVATLCLRSGNAAVLRGGSDAADSNTAIVSVVQQVLRDAGVTPEAVQLLPTDRKFVKDLLEAEKFVDIIIPRGSAGLIQFVRKNSKIPTIETGAGVCHTFVEKTANLDAAAKIVVNAKTQRPSVCNSLDTVLVSVEVAAAFLPKILPGFEPFDVEIFADERSYKIFEQEGWEKLNIAAEEDFGREFLGQACSVRVVDSVDEALGHVAAFSSRHSEAICSTDEVIIDRFLAEVDAAAVYANASTRFTDGGVFGLGAEIGISTQKLHARGPFALEKLVTEKWVLRGNGQVRE